MSAGICRRRHIDGFSQLPECPGAGGLFFATEGDEGEAPSDFQETLASRACSANPNFPASARPDAEGDIDLAPAGPLRSAVLIQNSILVNLPNTERSSNMPL